MLYTPSHAELAQHPKTRKLARLLGVSIPTAIGHLHLLWHFALKYAPDGDLRRFDGDEIADGCMWEGDPLTLGLALVDACWLEEDGKVHHWEDYGGKAIKQTKDNAKRQQEWRDRQKTVTPPLPNKPVTVTSPLYNALEENRGEESKEEEKSTPPIPPTPKRPAASPPIGGGSVRAAPKPTILDAEQKRDFEEWYRRYPNKQHRPEAERAWRKLNPDTDLIERLAADTALRQRGRKWSEGYIEHPATYLNNRVWEDDIEPVRLTPPGRAAPTGTSNEQAKFSRTVAALQSVGGPHEPTHLPEQHGATGRRLLGRGDA